jgi:hypothetical protein
MWLRWETSRLMIENAAREMDLNREGKATSVLVKLHVAEVLLPIPRTPCAFGGENPTGPIL